MLPTFAALPADIANIDTWFGGSASVVTGVEGTSAGVDAARNFNASAQAEVDFRIASGPLYFRLDLDLRTAGPGAARFAQTVPTWSKTDDSTLKLGPPEWAMLQLGQDTYHGRIGIVTRMIGLEDWDTSNNYFPTTGVMYQIAPGRMAGLETGVVLGAGYEVNVFGGIDLDYGGLDESCSGLSDGECYTGLTFGADFTTFQPLWSTFSGVAFYPKLDYYAAIIAGEIYPLPELTVSLDTNVGLLGTPGATGEIELQPYWGGQLVVNVLPAEPLHPMARIQGLIQSRDTVDNFLGPQPNIGASAGLAWNPFPEFKITAEGKVSHVDDHVNPGVYMMVALRQPEPPPYAAKVPEPAAEAAAVLRRPSYAAAAPRARQVAKR